MTAIEYADPAPQGPKVTDAPKTIWLVYGDLENDATHSNCYRDGDVGWCDEAQFASDVRYVRADVAEDARGAAVDAALDCRTCTHYTPHHRADVMHCASPLRCVAGSRYARSGAVREWESEAEAVGF